MDLNNVGKLRVKLTKSKTLKYGFGLEKLADNDNEESLAMAELYGYLDLTQLKWLDV